MLIIIAVCQFYRIEFDFEIDIWINRSNFIIIFCNLLDNRNAERCKIGLCWTNTKNKTSKNVTICEYNIRTTLKTHSDFLHTYNQILYTTEIACIA